MSGHRTDDNASTDDTAGVIDRHRASLPLRSVLEPVAGHSHARNRVLDDAAGDLIIWLDAGVLVAPPRRLVENLDLPSGSLATLQLGDDARAPRVVLKRSAGMTDSNDKILGGRARLVLC